MFVCRYINSDGVFFGSGTTLDEAAHDMMDDNPEVFDDDFGDWAEFEFFRAIETWVDTRVTWVDQDEWKDSENQPVASWED